MPTSWRWAAPAAFAAVVAGCDLGVDAPAFEPVFFATVAGDLSLEYEGTGHFRSGSVPRRPAGIGPQLFQIDSHGTGSARNMRFHFTRQDLARPEPGVHALGAGGFHAQLAIVSGRGAAEEFYMAVGGELVITESSPERIAGSFRFEGVGTCSPAGPGAMSCLPVSQAPADAPRVAVSGHFSAVPGGATHAPLRL